MDASADADTPGRGSEIVVGPPEWTTATIDATELALDWFEDHPKRG